MEEIWVQFLGWEDPRRREWQPTSAFLPGEFHGQRSLEGYSSRGHRESDTTKRLTLSSLHLSPISSAYEPGLCRHPGVQHGSLSEVRIKALWWRALHITRLHDQNKQTPSHSNTLTRLLTKNLARSSDRHNSYFIWKNIYHANREQIASSNKCLLSEYENIWVVFSILSTHVKRHPRLSNPFTLLYACQFPNMAEFRGYGWRQPRPPMQTAITMGRGAGGEQGTRRRMDKRAGTCLFYIS